MNKREVEEYTTLWHKFIINCPFSSGFCCFNWWVLLLPALRSQSFSVQCDTGHILSKGKNLNIWPWEELSMKRSYFTDKLVRYPSFSHVDANSSFWMSLMTTSVRNPHRFTLLSHHTCSTLFSLSEQANTFMLHCHWGNGGMGADRSWKTKAG